MGKISNILTGFAQSKVGKAFYSKALDPKNEKFINNTLPIIEQIGANACAITATALNPKIKEENKKSLQINNILKLGFSLGVSGSITKCINNFTDTVIENLDPKNIKNITKVTDSVKVLTPIVSTVLISRYLTPVVFGNLSVKIRDFIDNKKRKKIDFKA